MTLDIGLGSFVLDLKAEEERVLEEEKLMK